MREASAFRIVVTLVACCAVGTAAAQSTIELVRELAQAVEAIAMLRLLQSKAEGGDRKAQMVLSVLYHQGLYTPKDLPAAISWFWRSAEAGEPCAATLLGEACIKGDGTPKDPAEAAEWLRLSAAQGGDEAQKMLLRMYRAGQATPRDDQELADWTFAAARSGDRNAWIEATDIQLNRLGGTPDLLEACLWAGLAVRFAALDRAERKTLVRNREHIADLMTTDWLDEAESRLRAWKPRRRDECDLNR